MWLPACVLMPVVIHVGKFYFEGAQPVSPNIFEQLLFAAMMNIPFMVLLCMSGAACACLVWHFFQGPRHPQVASSSPNLNRRAVD
jgi:hypothetical protein